jgi:ferredoxin
LKPKTPQSFEDPETSAEDSRGPAGASHAAPSDTADQALDWQDLRDWFHQPRFNQRDGLDDYDGDYRGFDPLGKMITAHLRHRIQRLADPHPDDRHASAAVPPSDASLAEPAPGPPNRQGSAQQREARELRAEKVLDGTCLQSLSRMLAGMRTAAGGGATEVCAVFCHPPLPAVSLEHLTDRLPQVVFALGDRLPVAPGPAAWLGSLAMGASRVILVGHEHDPGNQEALRMARAILADLHLEPDARLLCIEDSASIERIGSSPAPSPLVPAAWEPAESDRDLLWQAVAHLHGQVSEPPGQTLLDPGAPFGTVALDPSRCTLCMACVGACPTNALLNGSPGPQIRFRERDCTQCGRCRRVCPEQAVTLTPRISYDHRVTGTARILHQDAPLRCSVCGAPYATAGIVDAVARRLAAHWMYQDQAARQRLTMCRDCRIRSCFGSPQAPPPRRPVGRKK